MIHPIASGIRTLIIRVWGFGLFFCHPNPTEAVCWLPSCATVEFFSPLRPFVISEWPVASGIS